jgi:hypothetical protein
MIFEYVEYNFNDISLSYARRSSLYLRRTGAFFFTDLAFAGGHFLGVSTQFLRLSGLLAFALDLVFALVCFVLRVVGLWDVLGAVDAFADVVILLMMGMMGCWAWGYGGAYMG